MAKALNGRAWLLGVAALCAIAAAAFLVVTLATADDHRYSAEIRRTEYGIPHILADDYGSLGYGYGYAFAQDNLCVMADRVVTLRGERSRHFGPTVDPDDPFADEEDATTNLTSDIYYRGLRQSGVVRRLLARRAPLGPTAELRQLVEGYVAGYNRYLGDTGAAHLPDPTCRGKTWAGPIMAVKLTPHGPRARTILTHSESANPTSPHYSDQTVLFSRKRWVTERFTEAEINADPHLQTTTLHG